VNQQIKKAFRKLAVKYHPDKNKGTDAERTFREMAEAYKVLSNSDKRRQYDLMGHEAFLNNQASVDPEDDHEHFYFFSDVFDVYDGEETHFHWSFHQDEDDQHTHFRFDDETFMVTVWTDCSFSFSVLHLVCMRISSRPSLKTMIATCLMCRRKRKKWALH
uniref:DnaJ homolog subfamily B member 9 n=1 Tax=Salarias fasciatus TaxID=181472 RepID=A0A672G6F3_SALFA